MIAISNIQFNASLLTEFLKHVNTPKCYIVVDCQGVIAYTSFVMSLGIFLDSFSVVLEDKKISLFAIRPRCEQLMM